MKLFAKFLSVGGVATLIQYAFLMLLVETTSIDPYIASSIGYIVSAGFNYTANYYFSFESSTNHIEAVSKFSIIVSLGLLMNSSIVFFLTEIHYINYIASQVIATCFVTVSNFLLLKHWAYK